MRRRYQRTIAFLESTSLLPFSALRERWKLGYSWRDLRSDFIAGTIVAAVAIPLGMALAIASGVPPQHGLYTVIIAGFFVALLGGSRFQVTGPTAAFVVILVPIVHKFGITGLLISGFMAGIFLVIMGVMRLGRLIQFIPHPVTTGFTSGIALVIASIQVKDFFGLHFARTPENFFERLHVIGESLHTWSLPEFYLAMGTLTGLVVWPKIYGKIPAPIIILPLATIAALLLEHLIPGLDFSTIGNRFSYTIGGITGHGIPQKLPNFHFPWNHAYDFQEYFQFSFSQFEALFPSAFAIAILGAIESLLSAVIADGLTQTTHDPDAELIALGSANIICPFFGGIAATGAIARTATNIRFGATSPIACIIHSVVTLLVLLFFAPYVAYLPMASLAALLMLVSYNISEVKHFSHIVRVAPRSDVLVLLICFTLTVSFDMVVGVTAGILLAALLFMQRMVELSSGRIVTERHLLPAHLEVPSHAVVYEIAGPLFFGAAKKAMGMISRNHLQYRTIIFSMNSIPHMDVTGLVAFESTVQALVKRNKDVYLVGLQHQPGSLLKKSKFYETYPTVKIFATLVEALEKIPR